MTSTRDLYDRHHAAIFRFLRRSGREAAEAEDLTQEVFLRAHRALDRFRDEGRDVAWLFRIARNLAFNRRRDRSRAPELRPIEEPPRAPDPGPGLRVELERALATLPAHEREAFLLRELGGLSHAEIASITETTQDAVRNRIHRARLALREALGPQTWRKP